MSAVLNLVGAFISIKVAAAIAKGIVDPPVLSGNTGLSLVFAALIGAIRWNLITWYFTLPSSSSHALIGGIIGATLVAGGAHAVKFHGLIQRGRRRADGHRLAVRDPGRRHIRRGDVGGRPGVRRQLQRRDPPDGPPRGRRGVGAEHPGD